MQLAQLDAAQFARDHATYASYGLHAALDQVCVCVLGGLEVARVLVCSAQGKGTGNGGDGMGMDGGGTAMSV